MIQRGDEVEVRAGGRHVDVGPRLVWFGFEREPIVVALIDGILTQIVERLAQALDSFVGAAAGVCLDALAPTPQDEYLRAELRAQVHRGASLLHGVSTHLRIVSGER